MIGADVFAVHPWSIHEGELHLGLLGQAESIFALSNGHIGLRGNLEEGEPSYSPGTFLNSFYEVRPLPYAESAYGNPGAGQTMINVTDGKVIRLLVDDEPFDVRYGKLVRHERVLDLRDGVLLREAEWVSPAGRGVRVRSQRLVSFVQPPLPRICPRPAPQSPPGRSPNPAMAKVSTGRRPGPHRAGEQARGRRGGTSGPAHPLTGRRSWLISKGRIRGRFWWLTIRHSALVPSTTGLAWARRRGCGPPTRTGSAWSRSSRPASPKAG